MKRKELIVSSIIIVTFILGIAVFKFSYRDIPQPPLAKDNIIYEELDFNGNTSSYQTFDCKNPKFKMAIPIKFKMNTIMENKSGKFYDLVYEKYKIEIRVIDIYGLTHRNATPRKAYSYNEYSDYSMKQCYREYIKSYKEKIEGINIIDSGIKKLKGNILIVLNDEQNNNKGKPVNSMRYNFLKDGYSIEIIGNISESSDNDQIINSMNSFYYYE